MPELRYLVLPGADPAFNLAAEQYVFDALPRDRSYLMLWQNDRAVIVGKYQNTLAEINKPYVDAQGIRVVRRLSGGGAVYHDLGNLNYTFILDAGRAETLDLQLFCLPVVRALGALGLQAELSGRNDIGVAGKKISGNAQYLRGGRLMHHGTLLFDSDLSVVERALQVDEEKIRTKGLRSVRSRVTNIRPLLPRDCSLEQFRQSLLAHILAENPGEPYTFSEADLAGIERLRRERYASWDWNYGASPPCTLLKKRRFEGCGSVEAHIGLEHGRIVSLRFLGDFFSLEEPETLALRFLGLRPEREEYAAALRGAEVPRYFLGLDREGLLALLCD
ncbi:MAG: lipoate--protein ligase [Oscillospiraceae bacterium]|nr:lipoate--protein ligase [Oscillospiraceae bacterium]